MKVTVDVYGHLAPGANKTAADRLDETGRNPHETGREEGGYGLRRNPSKRIGGAEGARTPDPKTASLVLSQLSYSPTRSEDYRPCNGLSRNAAICERFSPRQPASNSPQIDRSLLLV